MFWLYYVLDIIKVLGSFLVGVIYFDLIVWIDFFVCRLLSGISEILIFEIENRNYEYFIYEGYVESITL